MRKEKEIEEMARKLGAEYDRIIRHTPLTREEWESAQKVLSALAALKWVLGGDNHLLPLSFNSSKKKEGKDE
jgi:hypothetical protein